MALPPELKKLKAQLNELGAARRTRAQDRLTAELDAIDRTLSERILKEPTFSSVEKMTSPGGGTCSCCGK